MEVGSNLENKRATVWGGEKGGGEEKNRKDSSLVSGVSFPYHPPAKATAGSPKPEAESKSARGSSERESSVRRRGESARYRRPLPPTAHAPGCRRVSLPKKLS